MAYSQVEIAEKIVALEKDQEHTSGRLDNHDFIIQELDDRLDKILKEISGIKVALIFMAAAIAGNIPSLQPVIHEILKVLG